MSNPADNPYVAPAHGAEPRPMSDRVVNPWRLSTHCLLGLFAGAVSAAVYRSPWNEPIHWANIVPHLILFPIYFTLYATFHELRSVALTICLVLVAQAVAFNALIYALHQRMDEDFLITPVFLLAGNLAVFVGGGYVLQRARQFARSKRAVSDPILPNP